MLAPVSGSGITGIPVSHLGVRPVPIEETMQQLRGLGAIAIVSTMLVVANNLPCQAQAQQKAELVLPTVHWAGISDMVLSPDGKTFATAGTDWTVKTWDTRTAKQLKTFPGGGFEPLYAARYSPDGKLLASNTVDTVSI